MSATDLAASTVFTFRLEDLPNEAVELVAQHASSPSTPAACLLPLVCRDWRDAADRAQLLVDINPDLEPAYWRYSPDLSDLQQINQKMALQEWIVRVGAAAAATAVPAIPSGLLRAGRLAAWLARNSSRLRSLRIPEAGWCQVGPAWGPHVRDIRDSLTAGQGGDTSLSLPHLVQLELPIMNIPGTGTFLAALSGCPSLQHLVLGTVDGYRYDIPSADHPSAQATPGLPKRGQPIDVDFVARAVAPLTCLRVLHVEFDAMYVEGSSMAGLLRALPPTLEDMRLVGASCQGSIPLSCITHLVSLRCWERPIVAMVADDSNNSRGSGGGSSNSSSTSSRGGSNSSSSSGAAALTALTWLEVHGTLYQRDARLQLPNLRALNSQHYIEPAAWQQLQGMKHLRQLSTCSFGVGQEDRRDGSVGPLLQGAQGAAGLGGMSRLQNLVLNTFIEIEGDHLLSMSKPWAAAVAKLTGLTALQLSGFEMVAGGSTLLAPLTQLQALTVDCVDRLPREYYPDGAQGWAATPVGAVVQVVAAAVQGGRGQLQRLLLVVPSTLSGACNIWKPEGGVQGVQLAATAALPGLLVTVQDEDGGTT